MRNRAKCKKCDDVIESKFKHDLVTCKCGEISLDGGSDYHRCMARNWDNLLRIDDEDNIIIPKIIDKDPVASEEIPTLSIRDKVEMIKDLVKTLDNLPPHAMGAPITHYDYQSLLLVLSSILGDLLDICDCK
jgi:hypothetical protein